MTGTCNYLKQFCLKIVLLLSILVTPLQNASAVEQQLSAKNVLVLYKNGDTHSRQIAEYYQQKRNIPVKQIVGVDIKGSPAILSKAKFNVLLKKLAPKLTEQIKVIVMTWHAPYRVECMSITSAFALGFDPKYCSHKDKSEKGCKMTANNPYYNKESASIWHKDSSFRLSMMLTGQTVEEAKRLIDRGVAADNSQPAGNAYLVQTRDKARSTRWPMFKFFAELWGDRQGLNVQAVNDRFNKADKTLIKNKHNVLFYHTGAQHVPDIETNNYLPGAVADHLTSLGGKGIDTTGQMKAFRWLEAGVTGSYGTVIEPCNYPEKFPNPQVLIPSYLFGNTMIEAYWKSVQQPGEGLFVGEPLARPWQK